MKARLTRWIALVVLGIVIASGLTRLGSNALAGQAEDKPRVVVKVVNRANLDPAILKQAKRAAARIFARAGVNAIMLEQGSGESAHDGLVAFQVNILGRTLAETLGFHGNTLGFAPGTSNHRSRSLVYVFDHRAKQLAEQFGAADEAAVLGHAVDYEICQRWRGWREKTAADEAAILGHAMAHEIGHILLNLSGHSRGGIMRASWSARDMRTMITGQLLFDPDQAAKVRAEIRRRTRGQQEMQLASMR